MLAHQIMTVSPSSHDFCMIDYKRTMVQWNPFWEATLSKGHPFGKGHLTVFLIH